MGRPEAKIEDYLRKQVKAHGGQIRKIRWIGRRGAADNLIWWRFPRCALVEVKAPGEMIDWRSAQGREFLRMSSQGWPIYSVSSTGAVDALVRGIMNSSVRFDDE